MNPIDTYRDAFLKLMSEGMTYAEAFACFDHDDLQEAVKAEIERGDAIAPFSIEHLKAEYGCKKDSLFDLVVKAKYEIRQIKDFEEQAVPLMLAGWTSETPNPTNSKYFWSQTQIMSLYWRAPSKRTGKPGRRYLSTNQAYNAMMKAKS